MPLMRGAPSRRRVARVQCFLMPKQRRTWAAKAGSAATTSFHQAIRPSCRVNGLPRARQASPKPRPYEAQVAGVRPGFAGPCGFVIQATLHGTLRESVRKEGPWGKPGFPPRLLSAPEDGGPQRQDADQDDDGA